MVRQAEDTTTLNDLQKQLTQRLHDVRASNRPLYIEADGQTEAVLLSPAAYEAMLALIEQLQADAAVSRGLTDVREGRSRPAKEAIAELIQSLSLEIDPAA